MKLSDLNSQYDELQQKYGDSSIDAIYNGGCINKPDLCFVFMNPTARNIAAKKSWHGLKSPWIGTKNVWSIFNELGLVSQDVYSRIRGLKGKEWTEEFADEVYDDVIKHRYFLTNLGKCTQVDARSLLDSVFLQYLHLLYKEFEIVRPKVIILFGNQVSSIVLGEKISVSQCRKKCFIKNINGANFKFYSVYYPVGNGSFNLDKAIEDIKYIMKTEL